jgi:hypothetical protein
MMCDRSPNRGFSRSVKGRLGRTVVATAALGSCAGGEFHHKAGQQRSEKQRTNGAPVVGLCFLDHPRQQASLQRHRVPTRQRPIHTGVQPFGSSDKIRPLGVHSFRYDRRPSVCNSIVEPVLCWTQLFWRISF